MTEKLRYVGPTTPEFEQGQIYSVIFGVHQGLFEVRLEGREPRKYASLTMLLKFWRPAGEETSGPNT